MRTYTNMAWPGDPYRTGRQLYRRPAPRLTAFTTVAPASGGRYAPAAVAAVYLPLHRTRAVAVTERTLAFGFRAASIDNPTGTAALAAIADLDLMQARRHAAILAGHMLDGDLARLRRAAGGTDTRGRAAVAHDWADRGAVRNGLAAMFDCKLDLPGHPALAQAVQQAGITARLCSRHSEPKIPARSEALAAMAVERALVIALICARHLGRYRWDAPLHTGRVMAAAAWDCFPQLPATGPATLTCGTTQASRCSGREYPRGAISDRHQ